MGRDGLLLLVGHLLALRNDRDEPQHVGGTMSERIRDEHFEDLCRTDALRMKDGHNLDRLKAEARRARAREDLLERALYVVSTDLAQDALEDPFGNEERAKAGWFRLGRGAVEAVRAALSPDAKGGEG